MAHAIRIPQTNSWNMIRLSVLAVFHTAQGTMGFSTLMGFSFFLFQTFSKTMVFVTYVMAFQSLRQISTERTSHRLQTVRSLQPLRSLPTQMKSIRKIPQRNPQDFQSLRDWT